MVAQFGPERGNWVALDSSTMYELRLSSEAERQPAGGRSFQVLLAPLQESTAAVSDSETVERGTEACL